jgi:hypothetical protein
VRGQSGCSGLARCGEGGIGPAQQRREVRLQLGQRRQVLPDERLLVGLLNGQPGVQHIGLGLAGHVGDGGGDLCLVRRGFINYCGGSSGVRNLRNPAFAELDDLRPWNVARFCVSIPYRYRRLPNLVLRALVGLLDAVYLAGLLDAACPAGLVAWRRWVPHALACQPRADAEPPNVR